MLRFYHRWSVEVDLIQVVAIAPLSAEELVVGDPASTDCDIHSEGRDRRTVIYRSNNKRHGETRRNFEVFDAVEFIATIADHIPQERRHVRYYGALHSRDRSKDWSCGE